MNTRKQKLLDQMIQDDQDWIEYQNELNRIKSNIQHAFETDGPFGVYSIQRIKFQEESIILNKRHKAYERIMRHVRKYGWDGVYIKFNDVDINLASIWLKTLLNEVNCKFLKKS
jgi:hypothetical protein